MGTLGKTTITDLTVYNTIHGKIEQADSSAYSASAGYSATASSSVISTKTGDGTNILYAEKQNEINFGGTSSSATIYFGYRATDNKPIPSKFVFGNAGGTAELLAKTYKKSDGTEVSYVGHTHDYLPLSGGQLSAASNTILALNNNSENASESGLRFEFNQTSKGWVGYTNGRGTCLFNHSGSNELRIDDNGIGFINDYEIIHSGNYNNYALPLSGGVMTGTITSQSIIPAKGHTTSATGYNLGSSSNQFNTIYTRYIDTVSDYNLRLKAGGLEHINMIGGNVNTTANIIPTANDKYSLGSSSTHWKNVYATTFKGNLEGNISMTAGVNNNYRDILVTNGSGGVCYAASGAVQLNYASGDIKATSFTGKLKKMIDNTQIAGYTREISNALCLDSHMKSATIGGESWGSGENNAILTIGRFQNGNYSSQLGFTNSGLYYRTFSNKLPDTDTKFNKVVLENGSSWNITASKASTANETIETLYGVCTTTGDVTAKEVTLNSSTTLSSIPTGARVSIKFNNTHTVQGMSLNINGLGAKNCLWCGNTIPANYIKGYNVYDFTYDGTYWRLLGGVDTNTDTKNTAGATDSSSKLFLIGAEKQEANPQTYSHNTAYVGTDGCLYSNSTKVSVEGHTHDYAAASHGNHVPATQTANNAVFLRNDNTWQTITPANIGAAAASHGNHVPATQTANNKVFLRNDNTWQTITPANIGAVAGPDTSVSGNIAAFNSSDGKSIYSTDLKLSNIATSGHKHTTVKLNSVVNYNYYPVVFTNATAATTDGSLYIDTSAGTSSTSDGMRYYPYYKRCYCSGGFYEASDERLKNFGDDIKVDLDKLSKLSKKYFTWKNHESDAQQIGVSAQEVQELYPEIVSVIDEDGHLSVSYDKLSVVALKGIDILNDKVKSLEERLNKLEEKLNIVQ